MTWPYAIGHCLPLPYFDIKQDHHTKQLTYNTWGIWKGTTTAATNVSRPMKSTWVRPLESTKVRGMLSWLLPSEKILKTILVLRKQQNISDLDLPFRYIIHLYLRWRSLNRSHLLELSEYSCDVWMVSLTHHDLLCGWLHKACIPH
jgi:hypothetical protein